MGEELEGLKHNLKVSFSRMKQDICDNKDKIDRLLEITQMMQYQMSAVEKAIREQERPSGLKNELVRQVTKNKKRIIKQQLLRLISERELGLAELKDVVVFDRKYCSKASFYRYVQELKDEGKVSEVGVNNNSVLTISTINQNLS